MGLFTNLVSYWSLDGNSQDLFGTNHGTDHFISYPAGHIAQCANPTGSSWIDVGADPSLNITGDLSVSMWIKHAGLPLGNFWFLFCRLVGSGTPSAYEFRIDGGGQLQFCQPGGLFISSGANHTTGNVWNHVAFSRSAANAITLYLNGVSVGTGSLAASNSLPAQATLIGSRDDHFSNMEGQIDEVGAWSRVLTGAEITQLYNAGAGLPFSQFGPPISLQALAVTNQGYGLRLRFTQAPKLVSALNSDDAKNPSNYTVSGPSPLFVSAAFAVPADDHSVDVVLDRALSTGVWTLTVANIESTLNTVVSTPTSITFDATVNASGEAQSRGASNDDAEKILRKHLNSTMHGPYWDGIIKGLAVGDTLNWDNSRKAFDQLFKSTASGVYLDRKAGADGAARPENVGMGDELFRRFAIKTTAGKLTTHVLYEILEVFYGTDSVRASATSDLAEPFYLSEGLTLNILLDEQDLVPVTFHDTDFQQPTSVLAIEVAAAITRAFRAQKLKAWAVSHFDAETGLTHVRIYSKSLGLGSSVRIIGGSAQTVLEFPTILLTDNTTNPPTSGIPVAQDWAVSIPDAGKMRVSRSGATLADLNLVRVGDYVNIYGENFDTANQGSFTITAVDVRYVAGTLTQRFDVDNLDAVVQAAVTTVTTNDLLFFRPSKQTISNGANTVVVSQSDAGHLDINLPATTRAVERTVGTGAYVVVRDSLDASALKRVGNTVTVTTAANHGLLAGQWINVDDVIPATVAPAATAGNGTSTTDASPVTLMPTLAVNPAGGAYSIESTQLADGNVLLVGGDQGGGLRDKTTKFAITSSSTLANGGIQYTYAWTQLHVAPNTSEYHRLSTLPATGNVLLTGGWDLANARNGSYIYDVGADHYSATDTTMSAARAKHEQVILADGRVFVCGGNTNDGTTVATTDLFTPSGWTGGSWAAQTSMSEGRVDHAAVRLSNGKVLIIGGRSGGTRLTFPTTDGQIGTISSTCEIYDPGGNTVTRTTSMTWSRTFHRAVLLPNNQVLVVGGYGKPANQPGAASTYISACEIYDGNLGRWRFAGHMPEGRREPEIAYLASRGQVLVFGGYNANGYPRRVDLYDVATGTWRTAAIQMGEARVNLTVRQLSNGTVLVGAGATTLAGNGSDTFELYAPASDSINGRELNGYFPIATVPAANQLTYATGESGFASAAVGTITPATAVAATTIPGPYLIDPSHGVAITGIKTTSTQDLDAHQQYRSLAVTNASLFPDETGFVTVSFGFKNQMGPIRYFGRLDATHLILDYSFKMPFQALAGSTVTLLDGKSPWAPVAPQTIGALYITDSAAGRVAASAAIDEADAGGIIVNKTIIYPGDRGLGGEGLPSEGVQKLSDKVEVWAGNDIDAEVEVARLGDG